MRYLHKNYAYKKNGKKIISFFLQNYIVFSVTNYKKNVFHKIDSKKLVQYVRKITWYHGRAHGGGGSWGSTPHNFFNNLNFTVQMI